MPKEKKEKKPFLPKFLSKKIKEKEITEKDIPPKLFDEIVKNAVDEYLAEGDLNSLFRPDQPPNGLAKILPYASVIISIVTLILIVKQ